MSIAESLGRASRRAGIRDAVIDKPSVAEKGWMLESLLADDRNYFRAAADIFETRDYRIVRMPTLHGLDAGCIIEMKTLDVAALLSLARTLSHLDIDFVRFYQPGTAERPLLKLLGFEAKTELALMKDLAGTECEPLAENMAGRALTLGDDALKIAMFASDSERPDGKASAPDAYVELERRKIDAGYMRGFLIECDGQPAACFALSVRDDGIVRMKNLFTDASMRRRGCGRAILQYSEQYARQIGARALGIFAFPGGNGHRLYARYGMDTIGAQTEYYATLDQLKRGLASLGFKGGE